MGGWKERQAKHGLAAARMPLIATVDDGDGEGQSCSRRPAGAGNSASPPRTSTSGPVHPRGCGEQELGFLPNYVKIGSSPRVRGTPDHRTAQRRAHRFIPAGAGNRASGTVRARLHGGSSPRVRGTGLLHEKAVLRHRFIPAGAGNRETGASRKSPESVHPRGCGEQCGFHENDSCEPGSSPRVRGTGGVRDDHHVLPRFIPAGAENSPGT